MLQSQLTANDKVLVDHVIEDVPFEDTTYPFFFQPVIHALAGADAVTIAVSMLGLHVYHGLWSSTQTLGLHYPVVTRWRRPVSVATAVVIVVGYLSVPLAVLAGWVG